MTSVHAFTYRTPRLDVSIPVSFWVEGSAIRGYILNISERGVLVKLAELVRPQLTGKLQIHIEACTLEIKAQVAHTELYESGLQFCFSSAAEQSFIETLVRVLSRRKSPPFR